MNPSNNDFVTNSEEQKVKYQLYLNIVKDLEKLNEEAYTKDLNKLQMQQTDSVDQQMAENMKMKLNLQHSPNEQTDFYNYQPREIKDMICLSCKVGKIESLEKALSTGFCNECELVMMNNLKKLVEEYDVDK